MDWIHKASPYIQRGWNWVKATGPKIWDWTKTNAPKAWDWMKTKGSSAWNWTKTNVPKAWNKIKSVFSKADVYGKGIQLSSKKMYQLGDHFNEHGKSMGYKTKKAYEAGARAFVKKHKTTAKIWEGKRNSGRGVQNDQLQIIMRANGKQAIINQKTSQLIDFYNGTSLKGFINLKKVQ
jgi:hypothetical protein